MTYDRTSTRARQGAAFEAETAREVLSRLECPAPAVIGPEKLVAQLCGRSTKALDKLRPHLISLDQRFGDLFVMSGGHRLARLSCKSACDGTTVTVTDKHVTQFCGMLGRAFFIFAVVDASGTSVGVPCMLPASEFQAIYEANRRASSEYDPQAGSDAYFVGMQELLFSHACVVGWDAIAAVLSGPSRAA